MNSKIIVGAKLREKDTGWTYEIVTLQGYMNYDVGIERVGVENPDTEYIKHAEIGTDYELLG